MRLKSIHIVLVSWLLLVVFLSPHVMHDHHVLAVTHAKPPASKADEAILYSSVLVHCPIHDYVFAFTDRLEQTPRIAKFGLYGNAIQTKPVLAAGFQFIYYYYLRGPPSQLAFKESPKSVSHRINLFTNSLLMIYL